MTIFAVFADDSAQERLTFRISTEGRGSVWKPTEAITCICIRLHHSSNSFTIWENTRISSEKLSFQHQEVVSSLEGSFHQILELLLRSWILLQTPDTS